MIAADEFLEYADVFGDYYGTSRKYLREAGAAGNDLVLDIDVQGAVQVKRRIPEEAVSIFILPPSRQELEKRLRRRSEGEKQIETESDGAATRSATALSGGGCKQRRGRLRIILLTIIF